MLGHCHCSEHPPPPTRQIREEPVLPGPGLEQPLEQAYPRHSASGQSPPQENQRRQIQHGSRSRLFPCSASAIPFSMLIETRLGFLGRFESPSADNPFHSG